MSDYFLLSREEVEGHELTLLAPYAMKSRFSKGRVYPEPEHPYRTCYQRDRDRIIHSTAFRRLEYKTQVFVNHEGDYYRTRLTHSLEAAQIGRTIARALCLNEDLTETIILAHDLGHGPFGHSGEDALKELMKNHGGFDHNLQGLRIVEYLEERYPGFKGLNLSHEVREGINKHAHREELSILEAQIADVADEIAYDNHDLDDGITSGLISEQELEKVPLWKEVSDEIKKQHSALTDDIRKYQIIKTLIDHQVSDIISATASRLNEHRIDSVEKVRRHSGKLVGFSLKVLEQRKPLREFLSQYLYHHYRVIRMSDKAVRFIRELFGVYIGKPEQLPNTSRNRLKNEDPYRVVCDYIAGMTDRYALDEYKKLFTPYERV